MINYKDLNLTEEELDELQEQLNMRKKKEAYEENLKFIEENRKYIGKCYKEKNKVSGKEKYIRVLSSKSTNPYRFECMCFDFPVIFRDNPHLTKMFNPENAFAHIEFKSIYVESYPLLCTSWTNRKPGKIVDTLEEITEEDYFKKMDEYVAKLKEMIKDGEFETSKNNKSMFERSYRYEKN